MIAYKNKLKRDIVGSVVKNIDGRYGVYVKTVRNYKKGEEVFIGTIAGKNRSKFDEVLKLIK